MSRHRSKSARQRWPTPPIRGAGTRTAAWFSMDRFRRRASRTRGRATSAIATIRSPTRSIRRRPPLSSIRAAPRDPGYIQDMMYKQPEAAPIMLAMESCCLGDRPPDNVMGDLGDIAELLRHLESGHCALRERWRGRRRRARFPLVRGELQGSGHHGLRRPTIGFDERSRRDANVMKIGSGQRHTSSAVAPPTARYSRSLRQPHDALAVDAIARSRSLSTRRGRGSQRDGDRDEQRPRQPAAFHLHRERVGGESANDDGIWWNPRSEDGLGHQLRTSGRRIFATWFTYDRTGKAWWLVMIVNRGERATCSPEFLEDDRLSGYDAATFTGPGPAVAAGNGNSDVHRREQREPRAQLLLYFGGCR